MVAQRDLHKNEVQVCELWLLVDTDGNFINAIDEVGTPKLAFSTEKAACDSAEAHAEMYDIECKPVRIRTR